MRHYIKRRPRPEPPPPVYPHPVRFSGWETVLPIPTNGDIDEGQQFLRIPISLISNDLLRLRVANAASNAFYSRPAFSHSDMDSFYVLAKIVNVELTLHELNALDPEPGSLLVRCPGGDSEDWFIA